MTWGCYSKVFVDPNIFLAAGPCPGKTLLRQDSCTLLRNQYFVVVTVTNTIESRTEARVTIQEIINFAFQSLYY